MLLASSKRNKSFHQSFLMGRLHDVHSTSRSNTCTGQQQNVPLQGILQYLPLHPFASTATEEELSQNIHYKPKNNKCGTGYP